MHQFTSDELYGVAIVLFLAIAAAGVLGYNIRHWRRHTEDYMKGYDHGKVDGIAEGWRRGWTQPRDSAGRFLSPHRRNVETRRAAL
jgi:hypothetical protein